jgi:hypothetical protein
MSHGLDPIEVAVLNDLLAGQHPVLNALRAQLGGLRVTQRENTGAGFFTEFTVAPTAVPAPAAKLCFGDVEATIRGLRNGAGFLLYVDRGLLVMLEGYAYEEPWPETITEFAVRYLDPARPSVRAMLAKCQA